MVRLFGRPRHEWEDNVKMDLEEIGCNDMGFMYLHWQALVNAVMNLQIP
jgi:hypothetical protein